MLFIPEVDKRGTIEMCQQVLWEYHKKNFSQWSYIDWISHSNPEEAIEILNNIHQGGYFYGIMLDLS